MRTNNSMTLREVLNSIQKSYSQLSVYQRQVSSGKRITAPSDDPVGIYRSFNLSTNIAQLQQYQNNIDNSLDEMNALSNVLTNLADRLTSVKEIVVSASNGVVLPNVLSTMGYEVEEILKQIIGYGNSTINGKYIFSGFKTNTKPFSETYLGGFVNTVNYNGDAGQRDVEVNTGRTSTLNYAGSNFSDTTVPGLFMQFAAGPVPVYNIFNTLIQLRTDLLAGNTSAIMTADQQAIGAYKDYVDNLAGQLAVRIKELMTLKDTHSSDENFKTGLRSSIDEADFFESSTNLSNQQVAYQAALAIGAKLMQVNLFDYLK